MKERKRIFRNIFILFIFCMMILPVEVFAAELDADLSDTSGSWLPKAQQIQPFARYSAQNSSGMYKHWYGDQLTDEERNIYEGIASHNNDMLNYSSEKALVNGALKNVSTGAFYISPGSGDWTSGTAYTTAKIRAIHAYIKDFGQMYWMTTLCYINGNGSSIDIVDPTTKKIKQIGMSPVDYYQGIRSELGITETELKKATTFVSGFKSDYEKIKAAHDYVTEMIIYGEENLSKSHTITGGLLDKYGHKAVCESYSKLFRILCEENGIPCILVSGGRTKDSSGNVQATHMWNNVYLNGNWYLVDCTWDDGDDPEYTYFLAGASSPSSLGKTVSEDHMPVGRFSTVPYDEFIVPQINGSAYPAITSIEISQDNQELHPNGKAKISAKTLPATATVGKDIVFESSNPAVASVDTMGNVVGMSTGSAKITVSSKAFPSIKTECSVIVKAHTFSPPVVIEKGTCAKGGKLQYTCTGCGYIKIEEKAALAHQEGAWIITKDPTCEAQGERIKKCSSCGEVVKKESIPAKGHSIKWTITKEPTCDSKGTKIGVCSLCGKTISSEEIQAKEHDLTGWETTKSPTCEAQGERVKKCKICGKTVEKETLPAKGHTAGTWTITKRPTCETKGEKSVVCSVCGKTYKTEELPAKGHSSTKWTITKNATCTSAGSQTGTCSTCGKVIKNVEIPAKGHSPGAWVVIKKATAVSEGLQEQYCTVCKKKIGSKTIKKIKANVSLNASSIPLQVKKNTNVIKPVSICEGDSVKSWTSSNKKVVTVDQKGKITAKKTGTAFVTITMKSGASAKCKVTVQKGKVKTSKISLTKKLPSLKRGSKLKLSYTRTPLTATDKITFSSSNKKVATVDKNGTIYAKKAGTVTITIKADGKKKLSIKVKVL